jgi:hypothetical protein
MGMRSNTTIQFATEAEREFWNSSEYSIKYRSDNLLQLINSSGYTMHQLTTRGLYDYIYSVCGVQPGECLIKRVNDRSGYGDFTVEIRFVDAYTKSLFQLGKA